MQEVMVVLLMLVVGSAQITQDKDTFFGDKIIYVPFALICCLALLEMNLLGEFPTSSAILVPFVLFMMWLMSLDKKK